MKRFLLICVIIFCCLFAIVAPTTSLGQDPDVATTLIHSPQSPLVYFRILVHMGSINDPVGKEGLCELTAKTIAKGGTQSLTREQIIQKLYPMAATINVNTDKEVTVFIGEVHKDWLDAFYEIFAGLLLNPRFDPSDFEREKNGLINYLQNTLRGADDEELGKEVLNDFIYYNHPYGHCNRGTVSGLKSITLDDVKSFYKKMFTRDNIKVGLAGSYTTQFLNRVKADFSTLPAGKIAEVQLFEPEQIEDIEVIIVDKPCQGTAISLGFPIDITRADEDYYTLLVANSYFGEHRTMGGRLMRHMRIFRGLNYGDYSYIENFIQDRWSRLPMPNIPRRQQFFSIWIRPVTHENRYFALRQAMRELELLVKNGLTAEEFEVSRQYVLNNSKLWTQTLSRRLGYKMDSEFYGVEYFVDKVEDEVSKLTVDDVNAAIKKYLQYKNIKVAIVTDNAESLKEDLINNKVSPIHYPKKEVPEDILAEDKIIEKHPLNINKDKLQIVSAKTLFE